MTGLLQIAFFATLTVAAFGFKPVVLIHGILDHKNSLESLADRIREMHPGTNVTLIDKYHGLRSLTPIWKQIKQFQKPLIEIMEDSPDGIHMLGFSQGGLIARGLIQSNMKHNVHNFISLSSPQAGQYGDEFLHYFFPELVKHKAWKIFYSKYGQHLSIANYWRDPHHIPLFLNHSNFLALVNNIVGTQFSGEFKENFIKLRKLVLIGGPHDGIISPWESSQFGFYNKNETVVQMRERLEYKWDLFGLKTLDKEKRLVQITVDGVKHLDWHKNTTVIDNYILPHLD